MAKISHFIGIQFDVHVVPHVERLIFLLDTLRRERRIGSRPLGICVALFIVKTREVTNRGRVVEARHSISVSARKKKDTMGDTYSGFLSKSCIIECYSDERITAVEDPARRSCDLMQRQTRGGLG